MSLDINGCIQIGLYFCALLLLAWPLGRYMAKVFEGQKTILSPLLSPLEKAIYRCCGVDPDEEMGWKTFAIALLLFSGLGFALLYFILRVQGFFPADEGRYTGVPPFLAFNTAVSFITNTNWQAYSGEVILNPLTQMIGLTVQNFLSAAAGVAILLALIRALTRNSVKTIGNFWADTVRCTLYVYLPLSLILALLLVGQGVVQTFSADPAYHPLQSAPAADGSDEGVFRLPRGPVASQVAIKQLGTNGGGYYGANSAVPFENPTPFSNFLEMLAILLIPAALCVTYGVMVRDVRQGWSILVAMLVILMIFLGLMLYSEGGANPRLSALGIDQVRSFAQSGGNMEGKEVRFGAVNSALWAAVTTAASNGSVNAMHDSFMPLGGFAQLILMQLGEVVFGGVGSGLYGMLAFVIVAVFTAGLMVGRTPEYLGKKIEPFEMKMASLVILIMPIVVLGLSALAVSIPAGKEAVTNPGAHGFSQILYAFTSQGNNNGSAFAGLHVDGPFYLLCGGLAMLVGRFGLAVPILAMAGSLAEKKKIPAGSGTLPTHTTLFVCWLIAVVLIVGALNFMPALALGPIIEHLQIIG